MGEVLLGVVEGRNFERQDSLAAPAIVTPIGPRVGAADLRENPAEMLARTSVRNYTLVIPARVSVTPPS